MLKLATYTGASLKHAHNVSCRAGEAERLEQLKQLELEEQERRKDAIEIVAEMLLTADHLKVHIHGIVQFAHRDAHGKLFLQHVGCDGHASGRLGCLGMRSCRVFSFQSLRN